MHRADRGSPEATGLAVLVSEGRLVLGLWPAALPEASCVGRTTGPGSLARLGSLVGWTTGPGSLRLLGLG